MRAVDMVLTESNPYESNPYHYEIPTESGSSPAVSAAQNTTVQSD